MQAPTVTLVEQTVLQHIQAKEAFTALDISNALKVDRYPVRHAEVAATVRDIFQSGAMGYYDYDRKPIDVVTEGGAKRTQAFLYHHRETRARTYVRRDQDALPPVPADIARDLSDCVAAGPPPHFLPAPSSAHRPRQSGRTGRRQDGAFAIPRALVQSLGWTEGMTLTVTHDRDKLVIAPQAPSPIPGEKTVRVWGGLRVRVCKTKLRLGALTADQVTVEVNGMGLRICRRQ